MTELCLQVTFTATSSLFTLVGTCSYTSLVVFNPYQDSTIAVFSVFTEDLIS